MPNACTAYQLLRPNIYPMPAQRYFAINFRHLSIYGTSQYIDITRIPDGVANNFIHDIFLLILKRFNLYSCRLKSPKYRQLLAADQQHDKWNKTLLQMYKSSSLHSKPSILGELYNYMVFSLIVHKMDMVSYQSNPQCLFSFNFGNMVADSQTM